MSLRARRRTGTATGDGHEEKVFVTSSPGEMSEVEDGGAHEEHEDDEGDSEDEDEDDEDDEEPALKYERIGGSLNDLLKKDSASALAISNRLMVCTHTYPPPSYFNNTPQALGTHGGIVHILDLKGTRIKSYKPHQASIVDISMDITADFVATASIDGKPPPSLPHHLSPTS